jgi:hypothetical protein
MIQESLPRPIENFVANLSANQFNVNAHLAPAGSSLSFSLQTMKFEGVHRRKQEADQGGVTG